MPARFLPQANVWDADNRVNLGISLGLPSARGRLRRLDECSEKALHSILCQDLMPNTMLRMVPLWTKVCNEHLPRRLNDVRFILKLWKALRNYGPAYVAESLLQRVRIRRSVIVKRTATQLVCVMC